MNKGHSASKFELSSLMKEVNKEQSEYGNSLNDFKIISELGRGAYGIAYQVLSLKQPETTFVLKRIPISHLNVRQQKEALFEVQILRRLKHPHIIKYYTSFIESDSLFILMEYAFGGDLYTVFIHGNRVVDKEKGEGREVYTRNRNMEVRISNSFRFRIFTPSQHHTQGY